MLFQRKIDRAFKKLHEESDHPEVDHFGKRKKKNQEEQEEQIDYEVPELEKNDFLAMVIAALIVIVPVAILVLGGLGFIGYFFLMH